MGVKTGTATFHFPRLSFWSKVLAVFFQVSLVLSLVFWAVLCLPYYEIEFKVKENNPFAVRNLTRSITHYGLLQPVLGDRWLSVELLGGQLPNTKVERIFIPEDAYVFNESTEYIAVVNRCGDVFTAIYSYWLPAHGFTVAKVRRKSDGRSAKVHKGLFLSPSRVDRFSTLAYWFNRILALLLLGIVYLLGSELLRNSNVLYLPDRIRFQRRWPGLVWLTLAAISGFVVISNYWWANSPELLAHSDNWFFGLIAVVLGQRVLKQWYNARDYIELGTEFLRFRDNQYPREIYFDEIVSLVPEYDSSEKEFGHNKLKAIIIMTNLRRYRIVFGNFNLEPFAETIWQELIYRANMFK